MKIMRSAAIALMIFLVIGGLYAGKIAVRIKIQQAATNADAVVYIDKVPHKSFDPPAEHVRMDQKSLTFVPHILPILAGTTVDFHNSDDVLHNVFSPDRCSGKFNLGTWSKSQVRSRTFLDTSCTVTVLCNVHPEMEAFIVVLPTPYYAISDIRGRCEIGDVPPGEYVVTVWHEKCKEKSVRITVPSVETVNLHVELEQR